MLVRSHSAPKSTRSVPTNISVREAEVSGPNIFFPLLARKSSGFARICPDLLPENDYLKNSRGAAIHLPPAPWPNPLCQQQLFYNFYIKYSCDKQSGLSVEHLGNLDNRCQDWWLQDNTLSCSMPPSLSVMEVSLPTPTPTPPPPPPHISSFRIGSWKGW